MIIAQLVKTYLRQRFPLAKFVLFALLLTLFGYVPHQGVFALAHNFLFIYASLLVFRATDDAWSFELDRKAHPNRQYLLPVHFPTFVRLVAVLYFVYQLVLVAFFREAAIGVALLYLFSGVTYYYNYRRPKVMFLIPLLKYPVLIGCISTHSENQTIGLASASFLIMLLNDLSERYADDSRFQAFKIVGFVFLSYLIVPAISPDTNRVLYAFCLLVPGGLLLTNQRLHRLHILPIILFPILHVIYSLLL